ncbi:MAG TPA: hypothetical protein VJ575_05460, partial [Pseudogulbenkiania sp.]|nr:hypothetical protein [Pseudogulbenkiania sp.]
EPTVPYLLQCKCLASPSTHTYRLFCLLKSGADCFVSVAASAEEANYTPGPHPRQRLFAEKSNKFDDKSTSF